MKSQKSDDLAYIQAQTFKYRGAIWTILFIVILFLARPSPSWVIPGVILVVLGQLLRFWGTGCITLYRGEKVKAQLLTTWGPYALVRNPLYVANGLIGLGWGVMAGPVPTALFLLIFYMVYVRLIVPYEERFLMERFGSDYEKYCQEVGAFIPKLAAGACFPKMSGPWDPSIILKSEVYSLIMTVVGTVLLLSRLYW